MLFVDCNSEYPPNERVGEINAACTQASFIVMTSRCQDDAQTFCASDLLCDNT